MRVRHVAGVLGTVALLLFSGLVGLGPALGEDHDPSVESALCPPTFARTRGDETKSWNLTRERSPDVSGEYQTPDGRASCFYDRGRYLDSVTITADWIPADTPLAPEPDAAGDLGLENPGCWGYSHPTNTRSTATFAEVDLFGSREDWSESAEQDRRAIGDHLLAIAESRALSCTAPPLDICPTRIGGWVRYKASAPSLAGEPDGSAVRLTCRYGPDDPTNFYYSIGTGPHGGFALQALWNIEAGDQPHWACLEARPDSDRVLVPGTDGTQAGVVIAPGESGAEGSSDDPPEVRLANHPNGTRLLEIANHMASTASGKAIACPGAQPAEPPPAEPPTEADPATVTIEGRIGGLDTNKVWNPLPRVAVHVLLETPQAIEVVKSHTDRFGDFHVEIDRGPFVSYDIIVSLADADDLIRVRSLEGFAGDVIAFKQTGKLFPMGNEDVRYREDIVLGGTFEGIVPVRLAPDGSVHEDGVIDAEELQDGAHVYHHLHKAAIFGAQTFELAYDHDMTVDVYLYNDGSTVFYRTSISEIRFGQKHGFSSIRDVSSPHNREYHEWGHHVHADAEFGGINRLPSKSIHDRNHGNVANFDTSDSLIEGFAVFYSMLVRDEPLYGLRGHQLNLEEGNVWTYGDTGYEEWEIASLLWDLMDEPDDGGFDRIALGVDGLWSLLQDDTIFTVRDLYERLDAQLGDRRTDPDDPYTDLDSLFVIHRFWDDDDRDSIADADEEVGYATYYRDTDPPRERSGVPEGISLQLTAESPSGSPVPLEHVELTYLDAGGNVVTSSTARLDPDEPLLPIVLPGGTETIEIHPRAPGSTGKPIVLDANETIQRMIAAAEAGEESFDAITAELSPSPAAPPTGGQAVARDDGTVEVSWDPLPAGERVVVTRGIGGAPASPLEGEEVYRGTGASFSEPGVVQAEHHYSLFTIASDGSYSAPSTLQATPQAPDAGPAQSSEDQGGEDGGPNGVWIAFGVLLVLGAFWVYTGKTHRGPPPRPPGGPPPDAPPQVPPHQQHTGKRSP